MFAIIKTGGKQYTVSEGSEIFVEKINAEEGSTITFDEVLALGGKVGNPFVKGATVTAKVEKHGRAKKIVVRKFKKKKGYNRVQGHRQNYTKLLITELSNGK